jgi:DNA-binding transcriptional regulator YhcF (GntR family)
MKKKSVYEHLRIDYYSATPKYLQLANSILQAVGDGRIRKDDILPSINELSYKFEISRDTAEKAYKYLKSIGTLGSVPGKGYFVQNTQLQQHRIFLLFNKLSPHKKIIYDAFAATLGEHASIDFYIYNNDFGLFKKLLQNAGSSYTYYVIIPHFMEGGENSASLINEVPKEKLILLDKLVPGVTGEYGAVFENFEKDLYGALEDALPRLSKYHTLKIIVPYYTYHPVEIVKGFTRFCQQYAFTYKVVHNIANEPIKEGEVFINLMEDDLVTLIEKILATKMKPGKHVGIISYNETPLKKIILNGITTISTDFQLMGEKTAELILHGSMEHIEIPFSLTLRASL